MMSEFKYRLAIVKTEDTTGIGIERIKANSGDINDVSFIASIFLDERLSNRETMIRAVDEVLTIVKDDGVVYIRVSPGNSIFSNWHRVSKRYPNVCLMPA
jgi:hypothetical protein